MKDELKNDEDIYEAKIYHNDDLAETKIISGEQGDSYAGEAFYLLEPIPINPI